MKKSTHESKKLLWTLYLSGFVTEAGVETFQLLKEHTKSLPGQAVHWASIFAQHPPTLMTVSHILYLVCIPLLIVPFSYTVVKEWIYVDRMYVLRDLLEAKKIKPEALTPEQHHFIYVHWPDLF
jgi:hypothetical protein